MTTAKSELWGAPMRVAGRRTMQARLGLVLVSGKYYFQSVSRDAH
jgi:hypothetical protein